MSIQFLNNYPKNRLQEAIKKKDGSPLYGELWVYQQFLEFEENEFVQDKWFVKHSYNLSIHPAAKGKVEGEIDFIVLNKNGLLLIEVKGGGIEVENDIFYSKQGDIRYEAENPFVQVRDYTHSIRELLKPNKLFVYKAVVFPHENNFKLIGPQYQGYEFCFFSKKDFQTAKSQFEINKRFFIFIDELAKNSRYRMTKELYPYWKNEKIHREMWTYFPPLTSKEIQKIRNELFPNQYSTGFNVEKIKNEIILKENYEILKGLIKNKKIIIEGGPGTGKTVLAKKFIAEKLIRKQQGVFYCANNLIKNKLKYIFLEEYQVSTTKIIFETFHNPQADFQILSNLDFLVFDEAQEYFDKGLSDFIEKVIKENENIQILILYDSNQTIKSDFIETLFFYESYFIQEDNFSHFYFDKNYRCVQNPEIALISDLIKEGKFKDLLKSHSDTIIEFSHISQYIKLISSFIEHESFSVDNKIILVDSNIFHEFEEITEDIFFDKLEELTPENINNDTNKIRFTTPIKYRGLESKAVLVITDELTLRRRRQLYIGVTRAIRELKIGIWKL